MKTYNFSDEELNKYAQNYLHLSPSFSTEESDVDMVVNALAKVIKKYAIDKDEDFLWDNTYYEYFYDTDGDVKMIIWDLNENDSLDLDFHLVTLNGSLDDIRNNAQYFHDCLTNVDVCHDISGKVQYDADVIAKRILPFFRGETDEFPSTYCGLHNANIVKKDVEITLPAILVYKELGWLND